MIASLLSRFGRLSSRLALASALAMALGLSSLLPSGPAQAYESRYVYKADGSPLFELRFFDQGENFYYMPNESDNYISAWTLSEEQKNSAVEAASLWADVLGSASRNTSPLVINIGTIVVDNAFASCPFNDLSSPVIPSAVQEGIISDTPMKYPERI